jgi:hypothetical protein
MSSPALPMTIDPLHAFVAGAFVARTPHPLPLVATAFDVIIDAGVAIVATTRRFRNTEEASIEATITFPVPVHATLFDLTARVGDRLLTAQARRRNFARADYEGAIDAGQTAVLHEEVLRGVHMLSVAHVPPGAEVEVRSTWAVTLTNIDGRGHLRIPLTVGDIYGRSTLADSDDLVHGGRADMAELKVECRDGPVTLHAGELREARIKVPLNAPIDLTVNSWTPRALNGRAADGREASLRVEPAPVADCALDVAILVDHSGSMSERYSAEKRDTKHDAVLCGLRAVADRIAAADAIDLWEFDDTLDHVGSTSKPREQSGARTATLPGLIQRLRQPHGGTEIGMALAGVMAQSRARDLLLITDGKSYALDVQALARSRRRICVVLVGEDSLEANVGHLAALTGGEIFVASGTDLTAVLIEALRSLRVPYSPPEPISGIAHHTSARRGGLLITVSWSDGATATPATIETRAVAALAASLLLPALSTEDAATLAEAEGLVTHLTSLVLVDDAGDIQGAIPATRKIPLPSPRTHIAAADALPMSAMPAARNNLRVEARERSLGAPLRRSMVEGVKEFSLHSDAGHIDLDKDLDLSRVARVIEWDLAPDKLRSGDLSVLAPAAARAIRQAAINKDVVALARKLGLDPVVVVIGLLAYAARSHRTAARIARAIFHGKPPTEAAAIVRLLRLDAYQA